MARRRLSQTSITIWLDQAELGHLDTIRGDETTRSGYATSILRAHIKQNANYQFHAAPQGKTENSRESEKISLLPSVTSQDYPLLSNDNNQCHKPTKVHHQSHMTYDINPEIVRHAIFRLRARVHNRLRRPALSINDLEEATYLYAQGADWSELSTRYGLEAKIIARAISDVIHEINLMHNNLNSLISYSDPHRVFSQ